MIAPTVGRIVWYYPAGQWDRHRGLGSKGGPLAAIVTHVHSPSLVNLTVFDSIGATHPRSSIPLVQDGEQAPADDPHCEWMPYQKGQAAKAEALAAELDNKAAEAPAP